MPGEFNWLPGICDLLWWGCGGSWVASQPGDSSNDAAWADAVADAEVPQEEVERVKGIEPSYEAWEAAVLPLNYTRSKALE